MRILVIEDEKKIATFIINGLKQSGFLVNHAYNGIDGLNLAMKYSYDAAVIDILLPKLDGLSVIEELRRQMINTPVIILSAKRSLEDRIKGLEIGGDDYLVKPFSFSELLARIQALIRRSSGEVSTNLLKFETLTLDIVKREIVREDKKITLQPREFVLLEYFMRNPDMVLSKTLIMEHVYDFNFDPQTNVVDVLVCRLRNKIDKGFENKLIHTVRGVGYVLKAT